MTNLTFTKNQESGKYEATFTAENAFCLHIETSEYGSIRLKQKHTDAAAVNYCDVLQADGTPFIYNGKNYEYDHSLMLYPRSIKVVSDQPATVAFYDEVTD